MIRDGLLGLKSVQPLLYEHTYILTILRVNVLPWLQALLFIIPLINTSSSIISRFIIDVRWSVL